MLSSLLAIPIAFVAAVAAQSPPSVVCIAGQCLQGFTNTTIGAKLTAVGAPVSIQLLPGQYTATTNPQLLHNLLTSSTASYSPSAGFGNALSSTSLPLDLSLEPGLAIYSQALYSGQAGFSQLPSSPIVNSSTSLTASSIAIANNVWVAVTSGPNRLVLWDAIPDLAQLPTGMLNSLSLLDMQSSVCSPACSGSSVCSGSGVCTCPMGFNGTSCESCASGFFGPICQKCPANCATCDDGISGSGICLKPQVTNAPATCNCLNGQCGSNGQCACNPGWTTADNGVACAKCAPGFFQTSTGDCKGPSFNQCSSCPSDRPVLSNGRCLPTCSRSQYFDPATSSCQTCDSSCSSCSGPGPSNCLACSSASQVLRVGSCVSANCQGSSNVIPGLGVCLSELVQTATPSGTGAPALPSITGLTNPTSTSTRPLAWWEILLMALGCVFIVGLFLLCWRHRARRQRAQRTALFVSAKRLDRNLTWRGRLVRLGERFFGHHPQRGQVVMLPRHNAFSDRDVKLRTMGEADDTPYGYGHSGRSEYDLEDFIDAYDYPTAESLSTRRFGQGNTPLDDDLGAPSQFKTRRKPPPPSLTSRLSKHSVFSEVTGQRRHVPEPRQPIRRDPISATATSANANANRLSTGTLSSSAFSIRSREPMSTGPKNATRHPTEAEEYVHSIRTGHLVDAPPVAQDPHPPATFNYWVSPTHTGSTRNPFRQQ
ncbi:hypothetical protein H0H81_006087 [Sphagnurus paluster]|uniref:EGF-like domain-containing protein n=1 Tax=Sphagnurus paluster TaxID=117069 RepID=A0A9P7FZE8_9AGAR|nr:hypothetical protein H0H81_006087 [Sphagnurus paluster]